MSAKTVTDTTAVSVGDGVATSVAVGLGWLFDTYVINIYALALPFIAKTYHAAPVALGFVASLFVLGYTVGTFGFGVLTDYLGRKRTLSVSIGGYAILTALTALSPSVSVLGLMRFLTGVGGGGELPTGGTFVAEMWPARRRGFGTALLWLGNPLGYLLAIAMAAAVMSRFGWRALFVLALVPGFLIWFIRQSLKESPRFEAVCRRLEEARQSRRLRVREVVGSPASRRHLAIGILIWVPAAYAYFALSVFLPTYMKTVLHLPYGAVLADLAWFYVMCLALLLVVGWLSDKVGRRPLAIIAALVAGAGGLLMFRTHSPWVFVVIGSVAYPSWVNLTWTLGMTYVAELFPTAVRGSGFGVSMGVGRIASIFAPVISGALAASLGLAGSFQIAAGLWVLYVIGFAWGRETKGKSLEEIDRQWEETAAPLLINPSS